MGYFVEEKPIWLKNLDPKFFIDVEFSRLIVFSVFHTPCINISCRSKSLDDYNWRSPWIFSYYLNKQLKEASSNSDLHFSTAVYDTAKLQLDKASLKGESISN